MKRVRGEEGVAVVLALGMVAVLVTLALVAGGAVALVVAHRKAQAAADLGALAAASGLQSGRDPCAEGGRVVEANGAALTGCRVEDDEVVLAVRVRASPLLGSRELRAQARAGPSGTSG